MVLSLTGWAQEPAEEKAKVPDFSKGFEMLQALGLPDSKGATWGKFESEGGYYDSLADDLEDLGVILKGGAWRFPSEDEKAGEVLLGGSTERQAVRFKRKVGVIGKIFGSNANRGNSGEGTVGTWTAAEVADDAKAILKGLARSKKQLASNKDSFSGILPSGYGDNSMMARPLILACQFYENGFVDEANQLAEAIFSVHRDPAVVIDAVVSLLADQELAALTNAFAKGYDWEAYARGMQGLVKKFPRGWGKLGAVRLLLPKVESRAKGEEVPVPQVEGVTFSPVVLGHFRRLTEVKKGKPVEDPAAMAARHGLDLNSIPAEAREAVLLQLIAEFEDEGSGGLQPVWPLVGDPGAKEDAEPFQALSALKMEGVIAMAALVTDATLMPQLSGGRNQFGRFDSTDTLVEKAQQEYLTMRRPRSRGEVARAHLMAALPGGGQQLGEYDAEEFRDHAIDWWRTHKDGEPLGLAQEYMLEGNSFQKTRVADWLAKEGSAEAEKIMEEALFAGDSLIEMSSLLDAYLRVKKGEGKALFDKYAKELREEVASGAHEDDRFSSGSYQLRQAGGVDGFLKQLEVHVSSLKPDDIVEDLLAGKLKARPAVELLESVLEDKPKDLVKIFIEAAGKLEGAGDRAGLLQAAMNYQYSDDGESQKVLEPEEWEEFLAQSRETWMALIEDTRVQSVDYYVQWSIRDLAGMVMESLAGEDVTKSGELWELMGDEFGEILAKRSAARAAGKEIPEYPDASQVDESRRGEIAKAVSEAKSAAALIELYEGLTWSEKLAWNLIVEGLAEPPPMLRSLPAMVTKTSPKLEKFNAWKVGTVIDAKSLKSGVEEMRGKLKDYSGQMYLLQKRSGGFGYEFVEDAEDWAHLGRGARPNLDYHQVKGGVYVAVASDFGQQLVAVWPAAGVESSAEAKKQQDKLWEMVEGVLSAERPQSISWVLAVLDAEAMKKKDEENEEVLIDE